MKFIRTFLQIPLYPFLIALAPALSLYVLNSLNLSILDVARPALVYLLVTIVTVTVSRIVSGSNRGAAILGTFLLLSMITYGFAFSLVYQTLGLEIHDGWLLPAWLILGGSLYTLLARALRRTHSSLQDITTVFNIFGMTIIAAMLVPLLLTDPVTPNKQERKVPVNTATHEWLKSKTIDINNTRLPDVYYIILDAYARGDVLKSRFDYDNSDFLDWLEMRGFFVGHKSHSNYAWTHLSLSATLNGEYLDTLAPKGLQAGAPQEYRERYKYIKWVLGNNLIKTNRVQRFFSSLGYRYISNDSGYAVTRKNPTSLSQAIFGSMNQFEEQLVSHSIARPLISLFQGTKAVRGLRISKYDQIVGTLKNLAAVAQEKGPKFVFYHLVSPHGPFCFDEEGGMIPPHPVYDASPWLNDKFAISGYEDWFRENYPLNLAGLNHYLKETFQLILDTSNGNAIIIIQSDHGTHAGFDLQSAANTDVVERFGILNAIYLPEDIPRDGLEQTMSSVNTFRIVLSNTFGLDLPLLEDRAFYSLGDLDLEEITPRLKDQ